MQIDRIHPDRATVDLHELLEGLRLGERAPADRPYLILNMIATADGAATIGGRTRALGGEHDRALFHALREQADAVMAGAGTATIERYGRLVREPDRRRRRANRGLRPEPVACLVSGDLTVSADIPLLQEPESRALILTRDESELGPVPASVEYLREPADGHELAPFLRRLRTEHDVRLVLCEGGPRLNRGLLEEGLVDELFLAVAPILAGGSPATTIVAGVTLPDSVDLELVWCLEGAGFLFPRYAVRRG